MRNHSNTSTGARPDRKVRFILGERFDMWSWQPNDQKWFWLDGIESCCVGVEGSGESICVRCFSPSALSFFASIFPLSPHDWVGVCNSDKLLSSPWGLMTYMYHCTFPITRYLLPSNFLSQSVPALMHNYFHGVNVCSQGSGMKLVSVDNSLKLHCTWASTDNSIYHITLWVSFNLGKW